MGSRPRRCFQSAAIALLLPVLPTTFFAHAQDAGGHDSAKPGAISIEGIVVNHLGAGVPDAEVRIESLTAAATDPPLAKTATGSKGEIAIELPDSAPKTVRFRVSREGFTQQTGELDLSDPDEPPFIDVTLEGSMSLIGKVTSESTSLPIAGAKVQCANGGRRVNVTTDADGAYSFRTVYRGAATLTVAADGYATCKLDIAVEEDRVQADLSLNPERPIEFAVVDNKGRPASEVFIEAYAAPNELYFKATTDAQGQATLRGVSPEATQLALRLNGDAYLGMKSFTETLNLPVVANTASQPAAVKARLTVTLAGKVLGTVVDARTGKPVEHVRVSEGRQLRYDMPTDWTGPDGSYELTGVRPGLVTLTFQHDDHQTLITTADVHTGKSVSVDAKLSTGQPLGGIIVDETGNPLDQVRVTGDKWQNSETLGLRAICDSDGKFLFANAPPGDIEFTFNRPGYGHPLTLSLASGKIDHRIVLKEGSKPLPVASMPAQELKIQPGGPVPDLVMTATDGTKYVLSELRGKYVFLDCWATWCGPCMAEVKNVRALHEATRTRPDFILIGISLDTDAKTLKKTCEAQTITWPQVFGPKSGAGEAFEALDGYGIPYTCLIGPDGRLIAQHLRGPELTRQVLSKLATSQPATR